MLTTNFSYGRVDGHDDKDDDDCRKPDIYLFAQNYAALSWI